MKSLTLLITGGIGSGKSLVSRYMEELGVPVYDSDSRTKALYEGELLSRLETALGAGLRTEDGRFDKRELARLIFSDNVNMSKMEQVVYPAVIEDFEAWKNEVSGRVSEDIGKCGGKIVAMESALALTKPAFSGIFDIVLAVRAPEELRVKRACERDGVDEAAVRERIRNQSVDVKTDLAKILSVSGQHGLFYYVAQARSGAIVEALSDKRRTVFDMKSRITTLADISIYTNEGELKLKEVFLKLNAVLGDADAPTSKASSDELKALFEKAIPDYDADRFYVSHMKKVVDWYNEIKHYASFDFEEENAAETENNSEEKVNE